MEPGLHSRSSEVERVERRVERATLARTGAVTFALALLLPASLSASPARPALALAASDAAPPASELTPAGVIAGLVDLPEVMTITSRALPPVDVPDDRTTGVVVASWYGPGLYGGTTACGQTYTEDVIGVAHRSLPCGTFVQVTSPSGITIVAPVIDRGPFVPGRSLDLSFALKSALGCSDLCRVRIAVVHR